MSEDQPDEPNYESTLEVDKAKLLEQIASDHAASESSVELEHETPHKKDGESKTVQMPAVEEDTKIERDPLFEEDPPNTASTIPMAAINGQETTNYAVPEELLKQISGEDPNRWETMEILLEEISEVSEAEAGDPPAMPEAVDEPSFILEKISEPTDTFEGELSSKRTSPVLYRLEFEARVNDDGTVTIPRRYIDTGHVRPGMRFKFEAVGLREDD